MDCFTSRLQEQCLKPPGIFRHPNGHMLFLVQKADLCSSHCTPLELRLLVTHWAIYWVIWVLTDPECLTLGKLPSPSPSYMSYATCCFPFAVRSPFHYVLLLPWYLDMEPLKPWVKLNLPPFYIGSHSPSGSTSHLWKAPDDKLSDQGLFREF